MSKILTISIAAYNVERFIHKALDSLINEQNIDDLEIFVVDDGTLKIAWEYAKEYLQTIFPIHKKNGRYGSVINISVQLATGRYFKQLVGDDWFDIDGLVKHLQDLKENDVDLVLTSNVKFFENGVDSQIRDNALNMPEGVYDIPALSALSVGGAA